MTLSTTFVPKPGTLSLDPCGTPEQSSDQIQENLKNTFRRVSFCFLHSKFKILHTNLAVVCRIKPIWKLDSKNALACKTDNATDFALTKANEERVLPD